MVGRIFLLLVVFGGQTSQDVRMLHLYGVPGGALQVCGGRGWALHRGASDAAPPCGRRSMSMHARAHAGSRESVRGGGPVRCCGGADADGKPANSRDEVRGWSRCGSGASSGRRRGTGGPGAPSRRDGTTGECFPRTDGNYEFTLNREN